MVNHDKGWMVQRMDSLKDGRMDEWMVERMEGWKDGWLIDQVSQLDIWSNSYSNFVFSKDCDCNQL